MRPYLLILAVCTVTQKKAVKSEFCLKPFPLLSPVFSKERKILPSVVRREIRVFVGPLKAPCGGGELGIGKEFTFLERDLPCILENLCV